MNQKKNGIFIAEQRKLKKLTQGELAEKMGVSINAVSKWERGLSFPDVSLYKDLCKELDISIEELINGEKSSSEEAKEKAIINTIKEKNRVKKKSRIKTVILLFIILIMLGIIIYNKDLKVNFIYDSDYLYDKAIDYLRDQELSSSYYKNKQDYNVFYSYHGFGIEQKGKYKYAYMWIYNDSYFIENDVLENGSVKSMAYKITFKDDKLIKVEVPEDGHYYRSSIKKIFPRVLVNQILNFETGKRIRELSNQIWLKKNQYYNYLNLDLNKITIDDLEDNNLIFSINNANRKCVHVQIDFYKDNKYRLYTAYKACRENQLCTSELIYTKSVTGTYDYNLLEIIKHSVDANNLQFSIDDLQVYEIVSGKGHQFATDYNNKYLNELLKSINVDLKKCADKDYISN